MSWASIITMILQLVGPYLMDWLKTMLDRWLNKTAKSMAFEATQASDIKTAAAMLMDKAITSLPRFAWGRRMMLMNVRRIVNNRSSSMLLADGSIDFVTPLSVEDQQELRESCNCAERELEPLD